jgi:hypothetical protein
VGVVSAVLPETLLLFSSDLFCSYQAFFLRLLGRYKIVSWTSSQQRSKVFADCVTLIDPLVSIVQRVEKINFYHIISGKYLDEPKMMSADGNGIGLSLSMNLSLSLIKTTLAFLNKMLS